MLSKLFKKSVEQTVVETVEMVKEVSQPKKIIDSTVIKKDIAATFEEVLKEFGLKQSKESEIDKLKSKLATFKAMNEEVYSKIETLKELGFTNTPSVIKNLSELKEKEEKINTEINNIWWDIKRFEEINKLNQKYSLQYPSYKFVDNNTMLSIMKKYNLVCGESFMYSKEIPDEALAIISNFKDEIKESSEERCLTESYYTGIMFERPSKTYKFSTPKKFARDKGFNRSIGMHFHAEVTKSFTTTKLKMIAPESHFTIPTVKIREFSNRSGVGIDKEIPVMKLNTSTNTFKFSIDKIAEVTKKNREVLDPIASLKVDGGYIILHAWDEEANIPEIKNLNVN